jgi:Zn-dependent protease
MNATIPLGRIAGVRIGLHWSVVGILVLVTVGLAAYQLPLALPGHSPVGYVAGGVAAAVLLVCSLLGHEVAHAVVARRNGVAVEGITLWLLGGIARLRGEARTPAAELRIAVVGPFASALLAGVFAAAAWAANSAGADELVVAVLAYLALLNVVLAVFNLVPAAPLDGGRVLRALLWRWSGDRFKAAIWSARAGLGLGYLLIIAGFAQLIGQSGEGLWWVLLGLFIVSTAAAEEQQAHLGASLADVPVRDVMSHPVGTINGSLTVEQFLRDTSTRQPHTGYPILNDTGQVEGLVTVRRLRAVSQQARGQTALRQVACPLEEIPTATPEESLAEVLPRLSAATDGRILVFDQSRLVGIISPSDITRTVADHGIRITLRGGADRKHEAKPPPQGWWYPGQHQNP